MRYDANEAILVLINLTGKPVSDYSLGLPQAMSIKDGAHALTDLFGGQPAAALTVTGGKFSAFKPLQTLNPEGTYILQLRP